MLPGIKLTFIGFMVAFLPRLGEKNKIPFMANAP
jgi:hypothetical protein